MPWKTKLAVQVCYNLTGVEIYKREINALLQSARRIEIDKMLIITKDEENTISENGVNIEVVPIWKWLLENGT